MFWEAFEAGYRAGQEHDWPRIVAALAVLVLMAAVALIVGGRGGRL